MGLINSREEDDEERTYLAQQEDVDFVDDDDPNYNLIGDAPFGLSQVEAEIAAFAQTGAAACTKKCV